MSEDSKKKRTTTVAFEGKYQIQFGRLPNKSQHPIGDDADDSAEVGDYSMQELRSVFEEAQIWAIV